VVCLIVLVDDMRRKMRKLWESVVSVEHGLDALTQMIFYPNAAAIDELERPEVLSLLPDIERRDILELGAGIGQVFYAVFLPLYALAMERSCCRLTSVCLSVTLVSSDHIR